MHQGYTHVVTHLTVMRQGYTQVIAYLAFQSCNNTVILGTTHAAAILWVLGRNTVEPFFIVLEEGAFILLLHAIFI